jgi:hypothetical protein
VRLAMPLHRSATTADAAVGAAASEGGTAGSGGDD